jgi:hypothetical protein
MEAFYKLASALLFVSQQTPVDDGVEKTNDEIWKNIFDCVTR